MNNAKKLHPQTLAIRGSKEQTQFKEHHQALFFLSFPLYKKELLFKLMQAFADKNADYFVADPEVVEKALAKVKVKKPNLHYDEIRFERMDEGNSIAMLHVGPFDDEPQTFAKMDAFCQENGLKRCMNYHREIYLNNKNRTSPQKLKTILRYRVQ